MMTATASSTISALAEQQLAAKSPALNAMAQLLLPPLLLFL